MYPRKIHLQKNSLSLSWKGQYQVLLTNPCAATQDLKFKKIQEVKKTASTVDS